MALDPVPWFIGGAAEHSAEAARNIAWNATNGRTGISTPTSLRVTALATPGGGVRIAPGGATIESTYAGATQQSYTLRNDASETVSVPANTGSSTVTRYVVAEVNDPQYAGSAPANPVDGPYNFFRVVSSLSSVHPRLRLATLRIPPSTSVITNSMITDNRVLLSPRREEVVFARPRVMEDGGPQNFLNGRFAGPLGNFTGEYFPGGAGSPNTVQIEVPEWATHQSIEASWMGVQYAANTNVWGRYWVEFGDEYRDRTWPNGKQFEFAVQQFQFDSPGSSNNTMRTNWILMDQVSVPAKLRGKTVTYALKGGLAQGAATWAVSMDALSGLGLRVAFSERAINADTL